MTPPMSEPARTPVTQHESTKRSTDRQEFAGCAPLACVDIGRCPWRYETWFLVHGAFADGSSWSKVIPLLLAKGLRVTSVAIPLTSFADDVAATRRAIAAQDGPTLLVGHSYGGVVITEAGNDPKVVALVYAAAFAPDANQSIGEISNGFPKPPGLDEVRPLADGFLTLTARGIEEDFAQDATPAEKAILVAVQPQTAGAIFEAKPRTAAWRSKPTSVRFILRVVRCSSRAFSRFSRSATFRLTVDLGMPSCAEAATKEPACSSPSWSS